MTNLWSTELVIYNTKRSAASRLLTARLDQLRNHSNQMIASD